MTRIPRIWFLLALVIVLAVVGILALRPTPEAPSPERQPENAAATSTPEEAASPEEEAPRTAIVRETSVVGTPAPKTALVTEAETAALHIDGSRYSITVPEGSPLEAGLDKLQAAGSLAYKKRSYSGLGSLVTEINGRASTGEYVWILYVNGKKAATGISSTRVRKGDRFEWKFEKSY